MKIKLFTYQAKEAVEKLKKEGVLRLTTSDKNLISISSFDDDNNKSFSFAYNFMIYEMNKSLDKPKYLDSKYPIWAWYKVNGRYKPSKYLDSLNKGLVRLTLEMDSSRVLLSDFDTFSYILSGGRNLTNIEIDYMNKDDEYFYSYLEDLFTLHKKEDTRYCFSYRKETIQACFYELFLDDVINITEL